MAGAVKSLTASNGLVTAASGGTIDTADITGDAVTFAKLQNIATGRILGRTTASSGNVEELTAGAGLTLSGGSLSVTKTLDSGTYTPTLTSVANVSASTAYQCQWLRVGNTVTVSGKVDVDPSAADTTQLGISLPVASNFGAAEDCAGAAVAPLMAAESGSVSADATNDRAQLDFVAADVSSRSLYFTFTYEVI